MLDARRRRRMGVSSLETILMNIVGQLYQQTNVEPKKQFRLYLGLSEAPSFDFYEIIAILKRSRHSKRIPLSASAQI